MTRTQKIMWLVVVCLVLLNIAQGFTWFYRQGIHDGQKQVLETVCATAKSHYVETPEPKCEANR
jgi:hypothetical protein